MSASTWIGLAIGLCAIPLAALGGCEKDADDPVTSAVGGRGGEAPTSTATGTAAGLPCSVPEDGRCDDVSDCDCTLCAPSALCQPTGEGCVLDDLCSPLEDACTCSDCDFAGRCFESHTEGCNFDQLCDFSTEGCGCEDCWYESTCLDNHLGCDGDEPDGVCDVDFEECFCNDCLGLVECLCPEPDECFAHACVCPGCWTDELAACADDDSCVDDGVCAWEQREGCHCADCSPLGICSGYPS